MPSVTPIADTLVPRRPKRADPARPGRTTGLGDHHKKGQPIERIKRLTRKRMTLEPPHVKRQSARSALENADQWPPAVRKNIHRCEIIEALRRPLIHEARRETPSLNDLA